MTAAGRTQDAPSHSLIETDSRLIIKQYTATENSGASTTEIQHFIVKLREREGQRVDLGRSLKGHL